VREFSSAPNVESVSPNYIRSVNIIPNDQYYPPNVIAFGNRGLDNMEFLNMPIIWDYVTGDYAITVAVLDTGIDYSHPDLNENMAIDSSMCYGRRFYNSGSIAYSCMDIQDIHPNSHGTHVAGIIGALGNNYIGVTGINWRVSMLNVNVFSEIPLMPQGVGAYEVDIINGINYVISEKTNGLDIRVANMSFGGISSPIADNSPLGNAIKLLNDQDIICVMAAGNDGLDLDTNINKFYPACFRFDNTISVGNIAHFDPVVGYRDISSNYGTEWVDIGAPGTLILSTVKKDDYGPGLSLYGIKGYGIMSGTSMAAPHVAGAAAILCSLFINESASEIKSRLLIGANKNPFGHWKYGILDILGAFLLITTSSDLPDGNIKSVYFQKLSSSNIVPVSWSIDDGDLPPGLDLNSNGIIYGIPTMDGIFTFSIKAEYNGSFVTKSFSIYIDPNVSDVILRDGWIEIDTPWGTTEEFRFSYGCRIDLGPNQYEPGSGYAFRFIPSPSNAMVDSIEWESDVFNIANPNQPASLFDIPFISYGYLWGTVNEYFPDGYYRMEYNISP
jgi:subtilisin family serine protease